MRHVVRLGPFHGMDDRYVVDRYDATFWKMREMSLRYQLPRSLVERVGVDRASVSLSGRNLFFFWRRTRCNLSLDSALFIALFNFIVDHHNAAY